MRRALLVCTTPCAILAATSALALASSHQVPACSGPTPLVNEAWQPFDNSPSYLEVNAGCGSAQVVGGSAATSGLAAADILRLSSNVPAGALAGWRLTAPSGDSIAAITLQRDLYDQSEGWEPQLVNAEGAVLPGEACPFNAGAGGCESAGPSSQSGLDTQSLALELLCNPAPVQLTACANGFSQHDARTELDTASVTINDPTPPAIAATSGSLFAPGLASGTLSGSVQGSDNSGVQYARLYVDGSEREQQANACDFYRPAPCPINSVDELSLDTRTLSGGPHEIQVALIDAAGNRTLNAPVQINVANASPGPPTGLLVDGQSSGAWINHPAAITWSNPSQPSFDPLSQADWIACSGRDASPPASGCEAEQHQSASVSSLSFAPAAAPMFAASPQGLYTIFLWYQDAAGNGSRANAAAISFGYQTSPPARPASISVKGRGPFTITLGASADPAPISATRWSACNPSGLCTPTQRSPGLSFEFAPSALARFHRSPYGRFTIRAWLEDAAGNSDPANSASIAIEHERSGKPSPRLHILHLTRSGHWLLVRGSAAYTLSGRLSILARYAVGRHIYAARKTVRVSKGRWAANLWLPSRGRTEQVTAIRASSKTWAAQTVTRYVHHPVRH